MVGVVCHCRTYIIHHDWMLAQLCFWDIVNYVLM